MPGVLALVIKGPGFCVVGAPAIVEVYDLGFRAFRGAGLGV